MKVLSLNELKEIEKEYFNDLILAKQNYKDVLKKGNKIDIKNADMLCDYDLGKWSAIVDLIVKASSKV